MERTTALRVGAAELRLYGRTIRAKVLGQVAAEAMDGLDVVVKRMTYAFAACVVRAGDRFSSDRPVDLEGSFNDGDCGTVASACACTSQQVFRGDECVADQRRCQLLPLSA